MAVHRLVFIKALCCVCYHIILPQTNPTGSWRQQHSANPCGALLPQWGFPSSWPPQALPLQDSPFSWSSQKHAKAPHPRASTLQSALTSSAHSGASIGW